MTTDLTPRRVCKPDRSRIAHCDPASVATSVRPHSARRVQRVPGGADDQAKTRADANPDRDPRRAPNKQSHDEPLPGTQGKRSTVTYASMSERTAGYGTAGGENVPPLAVDPDVYGVISVRDLLDGRAEHSRQPCGQRYYPRAQERVAPGP